MIAAAPMHLPNARVLVHVPSLPACIGTVMAQWDSPEGLLYSVAIGQSGAIVHHRWLVAMASLPDRALCHFIAPGGSA